MTDPVELYVATLSEVQRQAAQLSTSGEEGASGGDRAISDSNGWVVLESRSTPAQLPGEAGCSTWPQQQWQIAYEILFCQCPIEIARLRPHQADDMLFFAYTDEAAAAACTRLFVRRRQAKQASLPSDLRWGPPQADPSNPTSSSSKAVQVDWRASVLLMVVLQTGYHLSAVTSADAELLSAFVESRGSSSSRVGRGNSSTGGDGSPAGLHHVSKVVHASPSRVPVNLDNSRSDAGRPQSSYPDICFAVDDFDDAFQSQVLREPAECYCVLLQADLAASWRLPVVLAAGGGGGGRIGREGGAVVGGLTDAVAAQLARVALSLPQQLQQEGAVLASSGGSCHSHKSQRQSAQSEGGGDESPTVVFSGYVSHQQLTEALGSQLGGDPVRQVLRAAAAAARGQQQGQQGKQQPLATCRVTMRGPGGRGAADVAVCSYSPGGLPTSTGQQPAPSGGSRPKLLQRAQLLAKGMAAAAKQATAQAAGIKASGASNIEQLHLRCTLQALQVPVDMLADSILRALPQ